MPHSPHRHAFGDFITKQFTFQLINNDVKSNFLVKCSKYQSSINRKFNLLNLYIFLFNNESQSR